MTAHITMYSTGTCPFCDRAEALRFLSLYLWRAHLPGEIAASRQK